MKDKGHVDRRSFLKQTTKAVAAGSVMTASLAGAESPLDRPSPKKKIKVGVIGCGRVAWQYLPELARSPFVELVSTCDIVPQRAKKKARTFKIPNAYSSLDEMLSGAPIDMVVTLTDIQEHYRLNKQALEAGKHVWSEKPFAATYEQGRQLSELADRKGVRLLAAPTVIESKQFAYMARTLASDELGQISNARARYASSGPRWSAFFYQKGGGSLFDIGVYKVAMLIGLLGPVREVTGMTRIVTPERVIERDGTKKTIKVTAEDNTMLVMDHGNGTLSHVQCGFCYSSPAYAASGIPDYTVSVVGNKGNMHLAGYAWGPEGVDVSKPGQGKLTRHCAGAQGYSWRQGASNMAETLVTGREFLVSIEHALHVVEVMAAVKESQRSGRRIKMESTFKWPLLV